MLVAALASGCQSVVKAKPTFVKTQDEAASVLVTHTAVAPWSEVADAMAPKFTMTGDAAVAKVLPTTERIQEQVLSAFGANLAVGLPQISTSSVGTQTLTLGSKTITEGGVATTTGEASDLGSFTSTTNKGPGVVPTIATGNPAGVASLTPGAATGELGLDPVLQYKAANYLHQSVQMLNREVQSAAQLNCYTPYLVRLKFAVMPYRPRLGYSIHTRVSFFSDGSSRDGKPEQRDLIKIGRRIEAQITKAYGPPAADGSRSPAAQEHAEALEKVELLTDPKHPGDPCVSRNQMPVVVPLLAADDMQVAVKSRAMEAASQIGLAISAMEHGIGANAGANKLDQQLKAILNHDLSSVLTVARQSDNTLYVRIAPNNEASGDPSLVGQTYDIAVLLLAPIGYFGSSQNPLPARVSFVTYTEFRHALNGRVLAYTPGEASVARMERIVWPFLSERGQSDWDALTTSQRHYVLQSLIAPIQESNYGAFLAALDCPLNGPECSGSGSEGTTFSLAYIKPQAHALWAALSSFEADGQFKSAMIQLDPPRKLEIEPQNVFVLDDGKTAATAVLRGVTGSSARYLGARLDLAQQGAIGANAVVSLPAQSIVYNAAARTVTLGFASPAKWGVKSIDVNDVRNRLVLDEKGCDLERSLCPPMKTAADGIFQPVRLVSEAKEDAKAEFTFTSSVSSIIAGDGGKGAVTLRLAKVPAGVVVKIAVNGADVDAVVDEAKAAVSGADGSYALKADARLTFTLSNLAPGQIVTIVAEGKKNDTAVGAITQTFRVQAD